MTKYIRPLTVYKKENPELYESIKDPTGITAGLRKKQQENEFYWSYCYMESDLFKFKEKNWGRDQESWGFFWKDEHNRNNKATVTEMGKLLLYGWYYNIGEFTKQICRYVFNGYLKAKDQGKNINDLEFSKAVKHVRENLGYYCHNEQELKVYLLEKLFSEEIKPLLPPPPEKVKQFDDIVEICKKEKSSNLSADPNYYYMLAEDLESYTEYLQELLDENGISYKTLGQHQEERKHWLKNWIAEVEEEQQQYDEECKKVLLETKLLT